MRRDTGESAALPDLFQTAGAPSAVPTLPSGISTRRRRARLALDAAETRAGVRRDSPGFVLGREEAATYKGAPQRPVPELAQAASRYLRTDYRRSFERDFIAGFGAKQVG